VYYTTVEVTQVDEDLASDALAHAIDALSITLPAVDLTSVVIEPARGSRGAAATFIIEKPTTTHKLFTSAVREALIALINVRLHWTKPVITIDLVPAPRTE
jgi:hypothetical protein